MIRARGLYQRISDYENLCEAFCKAAKGKRDRREVIAFQHAFEVNIQNLRNQILNNAPDIGHYRFFEVQDPKRRSICAASFPERVLHHAIMNVCEHVLERYAIHDSYACRKNKGNRKALARAQAFAKKYEWHLKLDIRKYFDSIDHEIMMDQLARRFKDKDLLWLFRQILNTYHTKPGKGVPIGNLISQHLANFYLGSFDHWIKEERRMRGYIRYMDDMLVFAPNKAQLKAALEQIREYLHRHLALELKENVQLNRSSFGVPFLGFRVYPGKIRFSARSRTRFVRKFIQYEKRWQDGQWSINELVRHMEPLVDFTRAADAVGFRRYVIERFGAPS